MGVRPGSTCGAGREGSRRRDRLRADRALLATAAALGATGCEPSLVIGGVSFAPWMACVVAGATIAYVIARILEARLFDYDPRYFVWTFLSLSTICAFALWWVLVRPPPG